MPTKDGRFASYPCIPAMWHCKEFAPTPSGATTTVPVIVGPTAVQVAASNPARKTLVIANDSGAVIYVKYGAGASSSSYTHRIAANSEVTISGEQWDGIVTAARAKGTSTVLVTTVVPL